MTVGRTGKPPGLAGNYNYSVSLYSSRLKQRKKKKNQSRCLFFLPAEKAFIDGFGYAALLQTQSGFDLAFLSLFLSFLSPALSPRSWRGACKVSSHTSCYKNNPGFIGIAMGRWHKGERGLSGSTAQFSSLTRKKCTVIYCTACSTHWETEQPLAVSVVIS